MVCDGLMKKAVEVFLPTIEVRSKRRDRRLMIRVPLFPGYVFVRSDLNPYHHLEIVKTVGAVRLIGNQQRPIAVPEDNIDSLKIMVAAGDQILTGSRFKKGDRVIVRQGPFTGVVGVFSRYRGHDRVVVQIDAMGQFAAVEVDIEDVDRAPLIMG